MSPAEIITSFLGGFTILGGMTTWLLRTTIAPIRVSMDNLAKSIDRQTSMIDKHADTIDGHEARITRIEAVHDVKGCAHD